MDTPRNANRPSGTVEELDEHLKQGKPAMVYFSSAPVRLESVEGGQYTALLQFRKQCEARGLVESFADLDEFRHKFSRQLAATINDHDYFKTASKPRQTANASLLDLQPSTTGIRLGKEATELLLAASEDPNGCVLRRRDLKGIDVKTNRRSFINQGDARSRAMWEGAIDELASKRLIKGVDHKGTIYEVTSEGYHLAETLSEKGSTLTEAK